MCIFRLFRYLPDLGHYMGIVEKVVISRKNMVVSVKAYGVETESLQHCHHLHFSGCFPVILISWFTIGFSSRRKHLERYRFFYRPDAFCVM